MFLFPYLCNEYFVSMVIASSDQQQQCCNRVLLSIPASDKLSFLLTFLNRTIEDADLVFDRPRFKWKLVSSLSSVV